jgi:hypothetical protein
MSGSHRVAQYPGSAATFSFTPSGGGAIPSGGKITLFYPLFFFARGCPQPSVAISSLHVAGTAAAPSSTSLVITTFGEGVISANVSVTVTLTGLVTGDVRADNATGIFVVTSRDPDFDPTETCASGSIGDRVLFTSFRVLLSDRLAAKTSAAATFVFVPSAGGAISPGGTITIFYPDHFFMPLPSPSPFLSGGATANLTSQNQSSVVLAVYNGTLAASTPVTITLTGFTMGNASADARDSVSIITSQVEYSSFSTSPLFFLPPSLFALLGR